MKRLFIAVALILGLFCSFSIGQDLVSMRQAFETSIAAIQNKYDARIDAVPDLYRNGLLSVQQEKQEKGDLEAWVAIRNELERLDKEKTIPAGGSSDLLPEIKNLRALYNLDSLEREKSEKISDLASKYVTALEDFKKKLTVDGNFDEAVKVRDEIDKVHKHPAVMAAEITLAGQPAGAPRKITCPECDGVGTIKEECPDCSGTGVCPFCDGKGVRRTGLNNKEVRCQACIGTGKCRKCEGTGEVSVTCPTCRGRKEIEAPSDNKTDNPKPTDTTTVVKPVEKPKPAPISTEEEEKEMREYVATIQKLRELRSKGQPEEVSIDKVMENKNDFKAHLCKSRVILFTAHEKSVRVGTSLSQIGAGGYMLQPASGSIGAEGRAILFGHDNGVEVDVVYGIVNSTTTMLFEVKKPVVEEE